ncbi:hypothetical protein N7492_004830 [Penicillium capsulatum]|uniref:Protein root UVB sensitive/RUS domain-containing protein n=1 Tax=Penicillium capsulatum TaxID=69766 RepID=A0A9W9ICA4_9EURO|nr:hypothetical protein N7492_004830 [Penicillium capsulatum]KAJ6136061.1 hypothetical protein N7512_001221 [Penicillium capsulatum]
MGSYANRVTLREIDGAGNETAVYIYSEPNARSEKQSAPLAGRVDEIGSSYTPSWSANSLLVLLKDVFLPSGYPHSVTEDYLPYQVFDSLQAFCSSIAGLLSSRAVLQGVGVGNANASPTSALLLHILQDSSGRIATILFAHRVGTALEPECKMYRLAADIFNDIAMVLDCLSPMVPAGVMRVMILSTAGVLRALCGVAGGSSKASLSAHFARWGNLAELNAKDSSQETVISLLGMLVGSIVVSHVVGFKTTWIALLLLLGCHLGLNYTAVRSVQMTSLNRQRANIVFSALLSSDPDLDLESLGADDSVPEQGKAAATSSIPSQWTILTPAQVSIQEHIFPRDGALTWTWTQTKSQTDHLGTAEIGVSLSTFFTKTGRGSAGLDIPLPTLTSVFQHEAYIFSLAPLAKPDARHNGTWHACIILKQNCSVHTQLKAWMHALLAARVLSKPAAPTAPGSPSRDDTAVYAAVTRTLTFLNNGKFEQYEKACARAGWDLGIAALETRGATRMMVE